jgi:flavin reductase (DIM6/NTAB) family NADH-FMN oxidoreductase RutF
VNAEQTGELVWNMTTWELRDAVNKSVEEVPPEADEFELSGVPKASSHAVKPCRVAESPIHFECIYHQTLRLPGNRLSTSDVVFGRAIGIHISFISGTMWSPRTATSMSSKYG